MCVCIHIHTLESCSTMRKKDILPFVTTWMDLELIMLGEVSQHRMTNTVRYNLYVESKKPELTETERMVFARVWGYV